jgi:hypothetical protein
MKFMILCNVPSAGLCALQQRIKNKIGNVFSLVCTKISKMFLYSTSRAKTSAGQTNATAISKVTLVQILAAMCSKVIVTDKQTVTVP